MKVSRRTTVVVSAVLLGLALFSAGIGFGYVIAAPEKPLLPPCATAFVEYEVVTEEFATRGCTDAQGLARTPLLRTCLDGRRVVEMGELIGFVGKQAEPTSGRRDLMLGLYSLDCGGFRP